MAGTSASWLVGAYSASPTKTGWDPAAEGRYLDAVLDLPGVSGLEVPFTETLHQHDEAWLLRRFRPSTDIVLTLLSGTLARVKKSPHFGLASTDEAGRRAAVEHAEEAAEAVGRINRTVGREAVLAVEVHSAPRVTTGASSGEALLRSLLELSEFEWGGARLVVEHCDTMVDGRPPAKGLLPLEAELEAVVAAGRRTGAPIGIAVNWGRSVIEQRSTTGAITHVRQAREAGVLAGVFFSGCAAVDTVYGPAWADVHVPPAPDTTGQEATGAQEGARAPDLLEPASLLTPQEVRRTVEAAGPCRGAQYRGVKVAAPPGASVDERIRAVSQAVDVVRQAALPA